MANRRLVVNGDDFGFTEGVNRGIVEAHRRGILTATTLMANGRAFDHAVTLAGEHPRLDVGCHLVLVQGESVLRAGAVFPASLPELVVAVAMGRLAIVDELRAQIERILAAGLRPIHLDTHKHTHLLPPVLNAVARLSREYGIPWVRRPFDLPGEADDVPLSRRLVSRAIGLERRRFERTLGHFNCRSTDHFSGFLLTGRYCSADLVRLFRALPPGITEFMCHPGYSDSELEAAPTRLTESRQTELEALTAPETRQALGEEGIDLVGFRDLG